MKVLQINSVFRYGSTGRIVEELHNSLIQNQINSYVICTNYKNKQDGIYRVGNIIEGKIHAALTRITGLRGYFSWFTTCHICSIINTVQPEIIILHNLHNNYVDIPTLLSFIAKKNIKVIWVLHDCWAYTGGCVHYTLYSCHQWKNGCANCKYKRDALASWFVNSSKKMYNDRIKYFSKINNLTFVGVSDWISDEAKQFLLKVSNGRIQRIYNWIDLNVFYPRDATSLRNKLNLNESSFVILGVSQIWDEGKGLSHFLNIAKRLPDVVFVMVGYTSRVYPNNVIPVGVVDNLELLALYYSMADVFLNLTQQESFGKVTAEALACGTPVIVNNNTACPEVVGECGFVISNNNEEEAVKAIKHIQSVGKRQYSEMCTERARTLFSREKIIKQWVNLLNSL